MMIEPAAPHQKLILNDIGPASIGVEGDIAAITARAERFFQKFGRADSVKRITMLRLDRNFLVTRPCAAAGE
jgi:hypothetical protein